MKKILATLLAVCTVLSMLVVVPITATAETVGYVAPADDTIITTAEAAAAGYIDLATHGANALINGGKYYIKDAEGLFVLATLVNKKASTTGSFVYVTEVIDASSLSESSTYYAQRNDFPGIGYDAATSFSGTFDGQGKTIKNLDMYLGGDNDVTGYTDGTIVLGMFGMCGATIKNVVLDGTCDFVWNATHSQTSGIRGAGTIVAWGNGCTIQNCKSAANLTYDKTVAAYASWSGANFGVGGIVGSIWTAGEAIQNCTFEGTVSSQATRTGGIVGVCNNATSVVKKCVVSEKASVSSSADDIGGIVGNGIAGTKVENCENHGLVKTSANSKYVGGIFGRLQGGSVTDCVNTGSISAFQYAGGLIGYGDGSKVTISNSINRGKVSTTNYSVGGLAGGLKDLEITDCTNHGEVVGVRAGGIIAYAMSANTTITNTKNYGLVTGNGNGGVSAIVVVGSATLNNVRNYATITGSGEVEYGDTITDYRNTPTHFYGYQTRDLDPDDGKVDLRFVGSIDSANYYRAGFEITVTDKTDDSKSFVIKEDVAHAYVELLQEGGNITVPAYRNEGAYLFALVVEGIPTDDLANYTFTVKTYSVATEGAGETAGDTSTPNFSIVLQ